VILISHDRDFLDRVVSAVVAPEGGGRWAEYAGGYSDMLAQRGEDVARSGTKPKKEPAEKTAAAAPKAGKRKLSFNDKHALDTLPKQMAKLERRRKELQAKLDDPTLFARDRAAFDTASAALAAAQAELAAAEERWLELEILREAIEGSS
jgi:ATP-binding cassette subfamily F protein uup